VKQKGYWDVGGNIVKVATNLTSQLRQLLTTKSFRWESRENRQEAEEEKKEPKAPVSAVQQQQLASLNHLDASVATSFLPKKVDVACKRVIEPIVSDRRFGWFNLPLNKIMKGPGSDGVVSTKSYIKAFADEIDYLHAKYIQKHSKDTCRFLFGEMGATQVEFDYDSEGK